MLEMEAWVSLANSKKFSTHVDEPAFGTLSMLVKIMKADVSKIWFGDEDLTPGKVVPRRVVEEGEEFRGAFWRRLPTPRISRSRDQIMTTKKLIRAGA